MSRLLRDPEKFECSIHQPGKCLPPEMLLGNFQLRVNRSKSSLLRFGERLGIVDGNHVRKDASLRRRPLSEQTRRIPTPPSHEKKVPSADLELISKTRKRISSLDALLPKVPSSESAIDVVRSSNLAVKSINRRQRSKHSSDLRCLRQK